MYDKLSIFFKNKIFNINIFLLSLIYLYRENKFFIYFIILTWLVSYIKITRTIYLSLVYHRKILSNYLLSNIILLFSDIIIFSTILYNLQIELNISLRIIFIVIINFEYFFLSRINYNLKTQKIY